MAEYDLFSDWRFWLPTILAIIFGISNIILGRWGRKMQKVNLLPDCVLKPMLDIWETTEPGTKKPTGKFKIRNSVTILRHGGIIKYPKFYFILTFKNPEKDNKIDFLYGMSDIIQGTTMLTNETCGPWDIVIGPTKVGPDNIQRLYLMLVCKDKEMKPFFVINMYKFTTFGWQLKSDYGTKRKRIWNRNMEILFRTQSKEWLSKYGDKGKAVDE